MWEHSWKVEPAAGVEGPVAPGNRHPVGCSHSAGSGIHHPEAAGSMSPAGVPESRGSAHSWWVAGCWCCSWVVLQRPAAAHIPGMQSGLHIHPGHHKSPGCCWSWWQQRGLQHTLRLHTPALAGCNPEGQQEWQRNQLQRVAADCNPVERSHLRCYHLGDRLTQSAGCMIHIPAVGHNSAVCFVHSQLERAEPHRSHTPVGLPPVHRSCSPLLMPFRCLVFTECPLYSGTRSWPDFKRRRT